MRPSKIDPSLSRLGLRLASAAVPGPEHLKSGYPPLDLFLDGGLALGAVVEWGVPLGFGGRDLVLAFLAVATRPQAERGPWASLWVYPASLLQIYPPAWQAHGVDLRHLAFARTEQPIRDLKPALLDPCFKLIVLDMPQRLSRDDFAFLARQARALNKLIIILHNRPLTVGRGNVWAKLRLNCQRDPQDCRYLKLSVIRGLSPRELRLAMHADRPSAIITSSHRAGPEGAGHAVPSSY